MDRKEYENMKKQAGFSVSKSEYDNAKKNRETADVPLLLKDGKQLGVVSSKAYRAISNGTLDYYEPVSNDEKTTLERFKTYIGYGRKYNDVKSEYKNNKYGKGNIDLTARPIYKNKDGRISTVNSISVNDDGKEVLIPTIIKDNNGKAKELTDNEAFEHYKNTGEYLGKFDTVDEADEYAQKLHIDQDIYYSKQSELSPEQASVFSRYGLNPNDFDFDSLLNWANAHNFSMSVSPSSLTQTFSPKRKNGKKLTTEQEERDMETLYRFYRNESKRDMSETDYGAFLAANTGFANGLTLNLIPKMADAIEKPLYVRTGADPESFVGSSKAWQKTTDTHPKAYLAGDAVGSTAATVAVGGIVRASTAKVFPKLSNALGKATTAVVEGSKVGSVATPSKVLSRVGKWLTESPVSRAIMNDGITFSITSAAREIGNNGSASDVLRAGIKGLLGGAASGGVEAKIGQIGLKFLFDKKLQHKVLPEIARSTLANAAGGTAYNLTSYALSPSDEKPTVEELVKDFSVDLAFGAIFSAIDTINASKESKENLESLYNKMERDFRILSEMNLSKSPDAAGMTKLAQNIIDYSEIAHKLLNGDAIQTTINGKTGDFVMTDYRFLGQNDYVSSMLNDLDTIKNRAIEFLELNSKTSEASATVSVAAAETVTPQNNSIADTAVVPQAAVKTNASGELSEIIDSESIATFTPETASNEIKKLENILIAKGADDTSRKEIIDTAVEIEKTLDGSDKNISSVFDDVSKITSTALSEIQNQAGLSNAYWKLFGENFKTVPTGNAKENINFVTEYSNTYAEALKNNNPEKYNSVMLSADGQDLSSELPKTIMQNNIPNTVQNAGQYRLIATQVKNIINAADVQLESERYEIYGDNADTPVENNTEATEVQPVTEPKNITLSRLGDFYEAFGNEALELAEKLNLTPTYKTVNGVKTALVGFPVHALEKYQGTLGNAYNLIISDNAADTITDNTTETVQNQAVAGGTDVVDHTKGVAGLKLIDAEKSTLADGKTLVTGVYELNSDKDFNRKSYKKEKFDIFIIQAPYVKSVEGTTYGHYGTAGNKANGYMVTYLPAGVGVAKADTQTKAKALLEALENDLPELPLTIKAYGDKYRCYGIDEAVKENVKNVVNSVTENTDEITLPLKNKKELISYLKNHKGGRIGVTYNNGTEEVRTIVSASDTAIVTEQADGQRGNLRAKADELSYTEDGFVYTGGNGVTVSYRFIDENTVESTEPVTNTKIAESKHAVSYTDKEKQNWENSKDIIVYESDEQFEAFIEKVLKNEDTHKKIYFGKIPDGTAQMVLDKTGIDVSGHNIALKGYEIRKILLNSHGDEKVESARGQEPITMTDLKNIPSVITNPDDVSLSEKEYEGKPALLFEKTVDGKNYVVAYASRKHHDIAIQTMYKKRSLATAENANTLSSTPETTSSTASNNIVSQDNNIVNSSVRNETENYVGLSMMCYTFFKKTSPLSMKALM